MSVLNTLYKAVCHFFFPRLCRCCKGALAYKEAAPLCPSCTEKLRTPGPLICRRCGRVLASGGAHCFACRGSKGATYKCRLIRSAFVFNAPARSLVHALKYQNALVLAGYMGEQMAARFAAYPELSGADCVMAVPLFPARYRKRGFNQSELLARAFASALHLPVEASNLRRVRDTGSQTKLGREARLKNVAGAFICKNPARVRGKTILLIDDVCTTGATLEACAIALKQAGAKRVFGFTYARE